MIEITNKLLQLKELWALSKCLAQKVANIGDITQFEEQTNLFLPTYIKEYFLEINGTNGGYDENFFKFYSFDEFERIDEKFKDWRGIPEYQNLQISNKDRATFYIFSDYQFNLFCYGIQLSLDRKEHASIYAFSGEKRKMISQSFSEFIELYLNNSSKLFF